MVYITVKASPRYRQMSLEDLLFGGGEYHTLISNNETNTVTYERKFVTEKLKGYFFKREFIEWLRMFNGAHRNLYDAHRDSLYREFYIPKRSGGLRKIDAPNEPLMTALRDLKKFLASVPTETYHTSAYAYVSGRSTVDAVRRHQMNESQWFAKFDLHNFFGSTTPDFLYRMLAMVFPFSEIMNDPEARPELVRALDLCFKDGGLPQGTPISPFLTNLMMIPIDFALSKKFREFETPTGPQTMIYTRYADDFLVSSRYDFRFRGAEAVIEETLTEFGAPFRLNTEKTRYGSRGGRNWNLGVMLNKDNEITVGHKRKKELQNMLFSYAMDKKNGKSWDLHDVQVMDGLRSYYKMVEGDAIDRIVAHVSGKTGVDIPEEIRRDLTA